MHSICINEDKYALDAMQLEIFFDQWAYSLLNGPKLVNGQLVDL